MCKNIFIIAVLLLGCIFTSIAQINLPDKISPDWSVKGTPENYTGRNLYGHINGGAELFLEFGFENLVVKTYTNGSDQLILEVYRMSDSVAALGIYLHRTNQESPLSGLSTRNSGNRYQVTAVKGSYFIQVMNPTGKNEHMSVMITLLNSILKTIPEAGAESVFNVLPEDRLIEGTEGIFRGEFALQPLFTFGKGDIFLLEEQRTGVYGEYRTDGGKPYTLMIIRYENETMAKKAFNHVIDHLDPYLTVLQKSDDRFIFRDFANLYGYIKHQENQLRIRIHLQTFPD